MYCTLIVYCTLLVYCALIVLYLISVVYLNTGLHRGAQDDKHGYEGGWNASQAGARAQSLQEHSQKCSVRDLYTVLYLNTVLGLNTQATAELPVTEAAREPNP